MATAEYFAQRYTLRRRSARQCARKAPDLAQVYLNAAKDQLDRCLFAAVAAALV